jgi:hypothetical protein
VDRRFAGPGDANGYRPLAVDRNNVRCEVNGECRMFVNPENCNTSWKRALEFSQLHVANKAARCVMSCPFRVVPVRHDRNANAE